MGPVRHVVARAPAAALIIIALACSPSGAAIPRGTAGSSVGSSPAIPPPGTTCPVFPADNVWHADISHLPLNSHNAAWLASMGGSSVHLHPDFGPSGEAQPYGIPFNVVAGSYPKVSVAFQYASESDHGPYPFGPDTPVEGGSDRHALTIDKDACVIYELYAATYRPNGGSTAGSGAIFDLRSNALRPSTWTSADAAGLPIFAGLIRRDEVQAGVIDHAIRFTASQTDESFIWPARHEAGSASDPNLPPMGARFRLKAGFNLSGFSPEASVVLQAMKTYGLFLADNGSNWFFGGASENGWSNGVLDELKSVTAGNFEAVDESSLMVSPDSGQVTTGGGLPPADVAVTDFAFTPRSFVSTQGAAVDWRFDGPSTHTATDRTAMGLFDSGQKAPASTYSFSFPVAGNYPYRCSIHPSQMQGSVKVPLLASPASGSTTTVFTITWASGAPPAGFVIDVQIKRAGSTSWSNWRTGKTSTSSTFTPDAGKGTYRFHARLRRTSSGATSNYSAARSITVS